MKIESKNGTIHMYAENIDELLALEKLVEEGYANQHISRRSFTMKAEKRRGE